VPMGFLGDRAAGDFFDADRAAAFTSELPFAACVDPTLLAASVGALPFAPLAGAPRSAPFFGARRVTCRLPHP
jgi:hypothetical protein